jgi:hypothetical protein
MGRTRLVVVVCATAALAVLVALPGPVSPTTAASAVSANGHRAPFIGAAIPVKNPKKGGASSISLNWAGFASTGPPVSSVAGSWVQPAAVCPTNKVTQSAFWVGIDGFAPADIPVEQVGTDSDCVKGTKKFPGGPSYYAWYELVPAGIVVLNPLLYPVSPGDSLAASVSVSGSHYVMSISDSRGWGYTSPAIASTGAPQNSSAEWIAEAPTFLAGTKTKIEPLADFGSVSFTGATVNGQPVNGGGFVAHQINMFKNLKGKSPKASTSALDGTGHVFTVTWLSN